jgi:WD40 repeat protein
MGMLARLSREHLAERASISNPVFSPDGKSVLATAGKGPDFWDAETGRRDSHGDKTFTKSGGRHQVDALDFAADGRRIGAGMPGRDGGRLMIWDLTSEALVGEREVEASDIRGVLFSPDSIWLAWRGDGPVGVWNPLMSRFLRGTHEGITSMAFLQAQNGRTYLLTAGGRELITWELATMEMAKQQTMNSDRPLLGLSRDGRVVGFSDGRVLELWDAATVRPLAELRDLKGDITAFCRDTASGRIVVGTQLGRLYLWDPLASPVPLGHVAAHEGPVENLACGAEGRAVSIGWDGAKVWNLEKIKGQPMNDRPRKRI